MQAANNAQVAFYLTGQPVEAELDDISGLGLRPALFALRRDLTELRYDFPLLLLPNRADVTALASLSAAIDAVLAAHADKPYADRLRHHAYALERELRRLLAEHGGSGWLMVMRAAAVKRLEGDTALSDSMRLLAAGLPNDAELLDCGRTTPGRVVTHLWAAAQRARRAQMRAEIDRLAQQVADVLDVAHARSEAGYTPEALRASIGTVHGPVFDFVAFSRVLGRGKPAPGLPEARSRRLHWLLSVLQRQRFFADDTGGYAFTFTSCADALRAWRDRQPKAIELLKAMAIARLEIAGEYEEARHDALFAAFGAHGLDTGDMARFPAYLVQLDAARLIPEEFTLAMQALESGLPFKLLLQTDDILAPPVLGNAACSLGLANRQLVCAALASGSAFVLQAGAAQLFACRDRLFAGLAAHGPALISVFSGASAYSDDIPPYLLAAAAAESRAFPSLVYDPVGKDLASRVSLDGNPQPERDWSEHVLTYQDAACQRVEETVAFTLVDLLACDRRFAGEFARVSPAAAWDGEMVTVPAAVAQPLAAAAVPVLLMADNAGRLHKVIPDERLVRAARRCLGLWRDLQEFGGIRSSYANRAVAEARTAWQAGAAATQPPDAPSAPAVAASPVAAAPSEPVAAEPERSPDEPYIETARCSSCEECVRLNGRMFAYNKDKQAYIAGASAGPYCQLVEAAESCQVAVIHPGRPRDPNEPGLEELLARAAPFQ